MSRLGPALLLAALAQGCVLFNDGDDGRLFLKDGGVEDGGRDTGWPDAGDGGADGGDGGDACPPGGCVETSCTNGTDDDGDGIADCADFDCSAFAGCCDDGAPLFVETWGDFLDWQAVPTESGTGFPSTGCGDLSGICGFEPDMPSGVVRRSCTPLVMGAELRATFAPLGAPGCTDTSCDRFAALVLTAAQDMLPGRRLLDDLAVTVQANGRVRVTQAGRSLGELTVRAGPEGLMDVAIRVTPGVDDRGRPALFATVGVTDRHPDAGTGEILVLEREPFLRQRDLLSDVGGCEKVPGLFVAVEGQGDRVRVRTVGAEGRQCVNPSHFGDPETGSATLTSDQLGMGAWADGGLGGLALASTCDDGVVGCWSGDTAPPVRWDLLVEGTNVDPQLGRFTHVGWSLGHAVTTEWDTALGWVSDGQGDPKAGNDPPTCLDPPPDGGVDPCAGARSVRDPGLWPFTTALGQVDPTDGFAVAYAREWDAAVALGERDVFALHVRTMSPDWETPFTASEGRIWTPEDAGCDSLRHPELLPASDAPRTDGFWLLYTCVREGAADVIHRLPLSGLFQPVAGATPEVILSPETLGAHAAGGVRAAQALIAPEPQQITAPPLIRVWYVARDGAGRLSVGLAQGRAKRFGDFPKLEPYRGNPVLRADDAVVGGPCGESCELVGFDVARRADDPPASDSPHTLRFAVARRVDGETYQIVPLEQHWRPPR